MNDALRREKRLSTTGLSVFVLSLVVIATFITPSDYLAEFNRIPGIPFQKTYVVLGLCILGSVIVAVIRHFKIRITLMLLLLVIYIPVSLISSFYNLQVARGRALIHLVAPLALLLGSQITQKKHRRLVIFSLIAFAFFLAAETLYTSFSILQMPNRTIRYSTLMRIPAAASNVIASFLTPAAIIVLHKARKKLLFGALYIMLAGAVFATSSRGGIALLTLGSLLHILLFNSAGTIRNINRRRLFAFLVCSAAFVLIALFVVLQKEKFDALSNGRLTIIESSITQWIEHPLTGYGMVYPLKFTGSHSLLVELLREAGLLGLAVYGSALLLALRSAYRALSEERSVYFAIASFMLFAHMLIDACYFNYLNDFLFWFLTAAITAETSCYTRDTE